jgi:L-ascorbate metabolism protein UlaG (beta-lactamase superfamily)
MRITKYNQSCLLIETRGKRILIDPGTFGLSDYLISNDWIHIDAILVTHYHDDHCSDYAINYIMKRDNAKLYTSKEVDDNHKLLSHQLIKVGDTFNIGDIKVEVTKAVHGLVPSMRENMGFIIDDGNIRLYTTSDSISFDNNYKCDILCMPFNGNGLTFGIDDGLVFAKKLNPKIILPIHIEHPNPKMNPNIDELKQTLENNGFNYKILSIGESLEI